jgi:hypothetical protein
MGRQEEQSNSQDREGPMKSKIFFLIGLFLTTPTMATDVYQIIPLFANAVFHHIRVLDQTSGKMVYCLGTVNFTGDSHIVGFICSAQQVKTPGGSNFPAGPAVLSGIFHPASPAPAIWNIDENGLLTFCAKPEVGPNPPYWYCRKVSLPTCFTNPTACSS